MLLHLDTAVEALHALLWLHCSTAGSQGAATVGARSRLSTARGVAAFCHRHEAVWSAVHFAGAQLNPSTN